MVKSRVREAPATYSLIPLPQLLPVAEVRQRLAQIFPESFPDRSILVGTMAARVVFVFLYGGLIEGHDRYLRPSHVYFFTEEQTQLGTDADRIAWLQAANRPGHRPAGTRWYADTSREGPRDELIKNRLIPIGVVHKRAGVAITSSKPTYCLSEDFAALLAPGLTGADLDTAIATWRKKHLNAATLQRMALLAKGIDAKSGDVLIEMPDGTRIRVSAGPSAVITKGLIENFAPRHLAKPAVVWLSASDQKSYPQFVALSASVGLHLDLNAELPDLILVDLGEPSRFYFCEVVASDGPVTVERKKALLGLVRKSSIPESAAHFVSAFEDRQAAPFRKSFSQLAVDSWVWFRTEPDLLVILTTDNRDKLDPNK